MNTNASTEKGAGLSRRRFLRTAGLGGAALAAPMILPSAAFGANAPGNRITVGLIGMGKMMGGHLGVFLGMRDTQVLAVCDVESKRLELAQQRANDHYAREREQGTYAGCDAYQDFRDLVARDDIDAVVIATPNHWHALTAVAAMEAGKDVYCEKPLARTVAEGHAMADAARRYGRVFQTGSQQRSSREFRHACELVRNGYIGDVHTVHVNIGGPPSDGNLPPEPVPEGLDWDMWLGPAPWRPYSSELAPGLDFTGWPRWRYYRDYAGGAMTDWGAHHFDIAQWGLGMDGSGPVEVVPPDGEDVSTLTYRYANGVTMYHGGGESPAGVEFKGTKGRVMVNRGKLKTDPPELRDRVIGPNEIRLYESNHHQSNWVECMKTRRRPICDVEVGQSSAIVCHIGNIAYWLQRPLAWDPASRQFANDQEANRLLARAMRSPWRL